MGQTPSSNGLPAVSQPSQQVVAEDQTFEQARVVDAKARAENALQRARNADTRVQAIRGAILAEGEISFAENNARVAALALVNHQRGLSAKSVESAEKWHSKAMRRIGKFERDPRDYTSLVKAIRYAHVVEKAAARAENQAYFAEYYHIDRNRYQLVDAGPDDES